MSLTKLTFLLLSRLHELNHLNLSQEILLYTTWFFKYKHIIEDFSETLQAVMKWNIRV